MSDTNTPDLLVPDRRIVSIDEARQPEKPRTGKGSTSDYVTRRELVQIVERINGGITDASLAVGQKIYDQIVEETQEHLEKMHFQIMQELHAEFERRSLRGRVRRRWVVCRDWARGYLIEIGVVSPIAPAPDIRLLDAADALDPNIAQATVAQQEQP